MFNINNFQTRRRFISKLIYRFSILWKGDFSLVFNTSDIVLILRLQ